mgnify:CR=1 FL=1
MVEHLSDYMSRVKSCLKLISKHASMVKTQLEKVLKARDDLLNELNNKNNGNDVRVMTRSGKMTQEPLYPEVHCRCQNRRISGRGSRTVRLRRMVTGGGEHDVLPTFGPS